MPVVVVLTKFRRSVSWISGAERKLSYANFADVSLWIPSWMRRKQKKMLKNARLKKKRRKSPAKKPAANGQLPRKSKRFPDIKQTLTFRASVFLYALF